MKVSSILTVLLLVLAGAALNSASLAAQKLSLVEIDRLDRVCDNTWWCAFYPDSNSVVISGCPDNRLMAWSPGSNDFAYYPAPIGSLRLYDVRTFAFNSDSTSAVSAGTIHANAAVVWNPGWSTAYPISAASTAARARFTLDDRAIIALTGIGVKIISLETGEVTREIGERRIYSRRDMDLSPDGQRLVVGTDSGDIWMYDYESGQELWSHKQGYLVNNVQFSPDGSKLLITSLERRGNVPDFLLAEYDAVSGQQLQTYVGHTGTVLSARYNREGTRFVTTGYDSTVRVWSTETGEELARLDFGTYPHWAEFSKGGMRIVVAGEGEGGVWELQPASSVSEPVAGESVDGRLNVQPNPVRGMLSVPFTLPVASDVRLVVYDMMGKEVQILASGEYDAGEHRIVRDLSTIPSGPYLVVLRSEEGVLYRQIQVIH